MHFNTNNKPIPRRLSIVIESLLSNNNRSIDKKRNSRYIRPNNSIAVRHFHSIGASDAAVSKGFVGGQWQCRIEQALLLCHHFNTLLLTYGIISWIKIGIYDRINGIYLKINKSAHRTLASWWHNTSSVVKERTTKFNRLLVL